MTRFKFYSKSPENMELLLCTAVDDALAADGCSLNLKLPEDRLGEDGLTYSQTWSDWLKEEL